MKVPKLSVTLSLIVKKWTPKLGEKLERWEPSFDEIRVQENAVKRKRPDQGKVKFSVFKWKDDFAAARNALLSEITTDYWVWVDEDDEVDWSKLPQLLKKMDGERLDIVYLPYNYAENKLGESIAWHWRERIIRTATPFTWKGVVHETLIPENGFAATEKSDLITVNHVKSQEEFEESKQRNIKILKKEYKKNKDPRIVMNLADTYFGVLEFDKAIPLYLEHIRNSGSSEDIYHSWLQIAKAHWLEGNLQKALAACNQAMEVLPSYPDAYFRLGQYYAEREDWGKAIEWLKTGFSKPIPDSLRIVNQTELTYQPMMTLALSYAQLGRFKEARTFLAKVAEMSPDYPVLTQELQDIIEEGYYEQEAIDKVAWLVRYYQDFKGDAQKLLQSLPRNLHADPRLTKERRDVFPPKQWPDKSIVFFCAASHEPWGPDFLEGGISGSEEAIIYLSRELAKLGWQVTVYNTRDEEYEDCCYDEVGDPGVRYKPWWEFNPEDTFDVFVGWRSPQLIKSIKARVKCLDMHDTPVGHVAFTPEVIKQVDKVFFKSKFQREYCPDLPDEKAVIVSNGIVPEHFNQKVKRVPHKVIFGSSADRGLDTLLDVWPDVVKEVPDAKLYWYYGWNVFDSFHKNNPELMRWKWNQIRRMHELGVVNGGRISHEELAKEFLSCDVWAYPTVFPEINCITAIKSGVGGAIPVTSGYAALQETILEPQPNYQGLMGPGEKKDFTKRLIQALKEGRPEKERKKLAKQYLDTYSWDKIAKVWSEACESV